VVPVQVAVPLYPPATQLLLVHWKHTSDTTTDGAVVYGPFSEAKEGLVNCLSEFKVKTGVIATGVGAEIVTFGATV